MVKRGWVHEVEAMFQGGIDPGVPAFQAVGYRWIFRYVQGEWSLEAAVEDPRHPALCQASDDLVSKGEICSVD